MQAFKQGIGRLKGPIETHLARYLFTYRITPHSTTGRSPAELLLGRQPRSRLDLLHPDLAPRVESSQLKQKRSHDSHTKARLFQIGERVYVRNFRGLPIWISGEIVDQLGPLTFRVQFNDGQILKRHIDHVRIRYPMDETASPTTVELPCSPPIQATPVSLLEITLETREPQEVQ